ncbi:hypothetical protein K456DRAFT_56082 [Colletotrichum gloeosporioides 23]|nr:hypothetical protein K456DRAFT_56082 [Colletotrichum gloeosporioides 23]
MTLGDPRLAATILGYYIVGPPLRAASPFDMAECRSFHLAMDRSSERTPDFAAPLDRLSTTAVEPIAQKPPRCRHLRLNED